LIKAPGFNVNVGSLGAADQGNRYLLQPVTYAAGLMRRVLDHSAGIAAASPVVADVGTGNQGTASIASLTMVSDSADVVSQAASGPITLTFGSGNAVAVSPSVGGITSLTWVPGQPLTVGGVAIALNGRPADGDEFVISKTTQPRQNNTNALALVALRETTFVGRNSLGGGGSTITDAYAAAMADVGVRVQGAATSSEISTAVAEQAELRRSADAGVNLDEEAARLLQYQQAYQASAKVLQVAQSVFDTLLQAAG
jgi:flagellar hook-associated protein 1 FlgK